MNTAMGNQRLCAGTGGRKRARLARHARSEIACRPRSKKLRAYLVTRVVGAAAVVSLGLGFFGAVPARAATNTLPVWTPLTLINGWTNAPSSTRNAAVTVISGVVHFEGAIAGGTNSQPFILPSASRPTKTVYVPVDMCGATNGRLVILHNGNVDIEAESDFANAQCFTSLDGVSFAKTATGYTALTLQNGWTNYSSSTRNAAVKVVSGTVQLEGAIRTTGTNANPFTLPVGFRPSSLVYVPVDLCSATNGRLVIDTSGDVTVEAETNFSNAQCFTSLEGASFVLSASGYTSLGLQNGWTEYGTRKAMVKNVGGVVHFQGAIATSGSNPIPFTLPAALRPAANVFVKVDLCFATNGRLVIGPNGVVTVEAEGAFSNAQCFTSLEGASYGL